MKWFKSNKRELIFEDEEGTINSLRIIRKEFVRKTIRSLFYMVIILSVYILYLIITYQPQIFAENAVMVDISRNAFSHLTIAWSLFSFTTFSIVYLAKLVYLKFTPSVVSFIQRESTNIGYEFKKSSKSFSLFILLNSISITILIYMDFGLIQFRKSSIGSLFQITFLTFLILSLVVPVIWAIFNDKYIIKLKENFYILFDFHFKIRKPKQEHSNLVGIYLTSNRLSSKFDKCGKIIYSRISQKRWLPRRGGSKLNPYLHFHEFSTPINFQKQFLNIALALNEWQEFYGSRILCFNARFPLNQIQNKLEKGQKFLEYREFFNLNK